MIKEFKPGLEQHLMANIKGQPEACALVSEVVERSMVGFQRPDEPIGALLLLGPTGTGKTELVLSLAEFLYGSRDAVARYDMAEFNGPNSIETLIGANKHEQGRLGDDIDKRPEGGILLTDEIEKAHRDVTALLLAPTSAARITMANGSVKDLSKWLIISTSNLGAADAMDMDRSSYATVIRTMRNAAAQFLRPEMLARFDVVVFRRLANHVQVEIAELHLARELDFVARTYETGVQCADEVLHLVIRKGFHPREGARPMRRAIKVLLGNAIVESVKKGRHPRDLSEVNFVAAGERVVIEDPDDERQTMERSVLREKVSILDTF